MKKLITLTILFVGLTTFGQKHGLKLNLGALAYPGFIEGQYEYSLSEKTSIQIGAGYGFGKHRIIKLLEVAAKEDLTAGETNPYSNIKTPSFRLTAEMKFFTGENGPQGFYLSPFIRYYSYSANSSFVSDVNDDPNIKDLKDFKLNGNVNAFAVGLGIGSQWLIEDKWAIDIMWLGIGYGGGSVSADYTSNSNLDWDKARDDIKEELEQSELSFIKKAEVTSKSDGIEVRLKNPLPLVLRSSISVGYFF